MAQFTVFTPTYNRESTLPRVWDSLNAQTYRDFEWLIVDDGSTDQTEALVQLWTQRAAFPIRYLKQPNSGKHVALNRAAREAFGEFLLVADSDDAFEPESLAVFLEAWESIPAAERSGFVGVTARCRTQTGEPVGTPLPRPVLDSDNLELQYRYKVTGEKWGFVRTDVLRQFPCDESPEMGAFPWGRIAAAGFRTRYLERVLRTYYVDERSDSMSKTVTVKRPLTNVHRNVETLNLAWKYFRVDPVGLTKVALNLARFGRAAGLSLGEVMGRIEHSGARWLVALAWLPAQVKPVKGAS